MPATKLSMPEETEKQYAEKRQSRRAKIARTVRVRPSEPRDEHFEDLPISINASKEGIYFKTPAGNLLSRHARVRDLSLSALRMIR